MGIPLPRWRIGNAARQSFVAQERTWSLLRRPGDEPVAPVNPVLIETMERHIRERNAAGITFLPEARATTAGAGGRGVPDLQSTSQRPCRLAVGRGAEACRARSDAGAGPDPDSPGRAVDRSGPQVPAGGVRQHPKPLPERAHGPARGAERRSGPAASDMGAVLESGTVRLVASGASLLRVRRSPVCTSEPHRPRQIRRRPPRTSR